MGYSKVSCSQCVAHGECSQKTRMYVNYCGNARHVVEAHIRTAVEECRSRKGFLFKSALAFDRLQLSSPVNALVV